jgi:hypothetical protein
VRRIPRAPGAIAPGSRANLIGASLLILLVLARLPETHRADIN